MRRSQRRKDKEEESDDDGIHSDSDDDVRSKVKRSSARSPATGIKSPRRATRENSWNREMLTQALNESKKEVVAFNVRVPMCLALTLKHTNTTRKLILSLTAMILSAYIEYIEVSELELHVAYLSSPFLVFLAFEFTVLSTAFVLLLPTTLTEADMERHLHVVIPDNTLPGELLDRYEKEVSPLHKSHQVERYRLKTLKRHLGDISITRLSPALLCKYRDTRLGTVSPASLKRELVI